MVNIIEGYLSEMNLFGASYHTAGKVQSGPVRFNVLEKRTFTQFCNVKYLYVARPYFCSVT